MRILLGLICAIALCGSAVAAPPVLSVLFSHASMPVGGVGYVIFRVSNPGSTPITEVAFTATLPAGLSFPNIGVSGSNCGSITVTSNTATIEHLNVNPNGVCSVPIVITATTAGNYTVTTSVVTSNQGEGSAASATAKVGSPPTISKVFGAAAMPLDGTTSLTFTISNPLSAVTVDGVAFTDNLPSGLVVATPSGLVNTCGGTATATAGAASVSLSGGTLATSGSCTVSVNIQATSAGIKNNSTQVTSEFDSGNTTNTSILVLAPPTITKAFGAASVPVSGSTSLAFTISNPNAGTTLTGIGFSDALPAGLAVSTPNGLTGSCGGGSITAVAGSGSVTLSGATLGGGASCSFSVNVTASTAGTKMNTTGAVTSTNGGTGGTATASLAVDGPPSVSTAFTPAIIAPNGTASLTFTISNPGANPDALTGVAINNTLPAGVTAASATSTACGTGTLTVTAPGTITLTGGTIARGGQCQFSVAVTCATGGLHSDVTGAVTSVNGGAGNTATATLQVLGATTVQLLSGCPAGGAWSNAACWDVGRAPTTGDDVVIAGSAQPSTNYDLGAGILLHSITISSAGGALNVTGGPIGLQTGATVTDGVNNGGIDILPGMTLSGSVTVSVTTATHTLRLSGAVAGASALTKTGAGTLELAGASPFTGGVSLNGGTLNVTGSLPSSGVIVGSGGTLTGAGTVNSIQASSGGTVSGNLASTDGATLAAGSTFSAVISGAGTYTQLTGGTVNLTAGPTLTVTLANGYAPPIGTTFPLIPGAVTGTFAGLSNGAILMNGSAPFRVTYASVTLTALSPASIPALPTWALGLLGVMLAASGVILGLRRRNGPLGASEAVVDRTLP